MNDTTRSTAPVGIDPEHPWLGLASYTEETRSYFHGRDEEAAELARRVQRKNLTVLFGQSGLGKTSLLRAGLVPRLRGEGYCPVYVRVDYSADSPPPSEQIKKAIFRATADVGAWTRPGSAIEGESLWEFLHHRGDLLRDADGRTLLPLLIFDQFEEIFTLAQADDAGRRRAQQFIDDLADLVENRPPTALEERLEHDDATAEDFDFARADYRILIALREDYLAHLESLKSVMPSITQNRMRLARMTGEQALSAVTGPGGRLVSGEVAESIVRFVSGGAELRNAEVEPSLLSLVCRELNNVRIAQGRREISADLLAGSRDTILTEFYERALADQPAGVRRVIEDELLTDSGYRESLAEERVIKALAAAGAAPDALAKLVDRRLLRIEERLDVRRVELTHDVLCSVVAASRELRHEREARDEAERQLALQREREAATHRALVKTRMVAVVSALLMVVAIAGAIFGWVNYRRAHEADLAAQRARSDAEKLVGFLIEDFYAELQPTGRLETMSKLANLAVGYYDGLPTELHTTQTEIYHGMALIRAGGALLAGDQVEAGSAKIRQARELFEKLRADGDTSEPVAYGLALALATPFFSWGPAGGPDTQPGDLPQAADLLRPFATSPDGARQSKIAYADVLNYMSHQLKPEQAIATCEEARAILAGIGAEDLTDLTAASVYADTADSESRHAMGAGHVEDAERLSNEVYRIAEGVLAKRPGDIRSMQNRALAADMLGRIAMRRQDFDTAMRYAERSEQVGEDIVRFNPSDLVVWQFWIRGGEQVADVMFQQGRVARSIEKRQEVTRLAEDPRLPGSLQSQLEQTWYSLADLEMRSGRRNAADRSFEAATAANREFLAQIADTNPVRPIVAAQPVVGRAYMELAAGNYPAALDKAVAAVAYVDGLKIDESNSAGRQFQNDLLNAALDVAVTAALMLDRSEQAEPLARRRVDLPRIRYGNPYKDLAQRQIQLAAALAQLGKGAEAQTVLATTLEEFREKAKAGATGTDFRTDFAWALYVEALSQESDAAGRSARRRALDEAARQIEACSPEVRQLRDVRELATRIAAAAT